jgi:hypothetical protein
LCTVRSAFKHLPDCEFDLLSRKGVCPYDYLMSYDKLCEARLPARIESFYNRLRDNHKSETDYLHAVNVWSCFHIQMLRDYCNLCLKLDVLLLVYVFENFRSNCIGNLNMNFTHYMRIEFELLTDVDILSSVE